MQLRTLVGVLHAAVMVGTGKAHGETDGLNLAVC